VLGPAASRRDGIVAAGACDEQGRATTRAALRRASLGFSEAVILSMPQSLQVGGNRAMRFEGLARSAQGFHQHDTSACVAEAPHQLTDHLANDFAAILSQ
jgi:hypothetical protein